MLIPRISILLAALAGTAFLAGCDDHSGFETDVVVREVWQGTYASPDGTDRGVLVLDYRVDGREVTGEIAIRSRVSERPSTGLPLRGSLDEGGLQLALDRSSINFQFEFSLEADRPAADRLEGTITYSPTSLTAGFESQPVEVGMLAVDTSFQFTSGVIGMAFDDSLLWLAVSLGDFWLMTTEGEIVDTVVVRLESGAQWNSGPLTWNGTRLYGDLGSGFDTDSGPVTLSRIIEFDREGDITRDFLIPHRTWGLASEGATIWSLHRHSERLVRLDPDGAEIERVSIGVPDLNSLEYDGSHFWAVGSKMHRLYRLDRTGEIVRVYDLPEDPEFERPAAIAYDGTRLWYSQHIFRPNGSRIYRLLVDD